MAIFNSYVKLPEGTPNSICWSSFSHWNDMFTWQFWGLNCLSFPYFQIHRTPTFGGAMWSRFCTQTTKVKSSWIVLQRLSLAKRPLLRSLDHHVVVIGSNVHWINGDQWHSGFIEPSRSPKKRIASTAGKQFQSTHASENLQGKDWAKTNEWVFGSS